MHVLNVAVVKNLLSDFNEIHIKHYLVNNSQQNKTSSKQKGGRIINIQNQLLYERQRMQLLQEKAKKNLIGAPEGSLRLGKSQGCTQYFHCYEDTRPSGNYISKQNRELAKNLAQKAYDEKIVRLTTKRLRQLDAIIKDYSDDEIEQVFLSEHQERQKLITPVEELYEQKLDRWISQAYLGKGF